MDVMHRRLRDAAISEGASDAVIIPAGELVVQERLARYCEEPKCPNYGLSASCPPHVEGPEAFRLWRDAARHALVIRIDVPAYTLFGEERREVFGLLHSVVARTEAVAVDLSYSGSRGFAGGSCKQLFCAEHENCLRLSEKGVCRNPLQARQSLSGFGVDVGAMMASAGWQNGTVFDGDIPPEEMSWVAGLVLLIRKN